jgi:ribosome-associated translation inhibitor RaiA
VIVRVSSQSSVSNSARVNRYIENEMTNLLSRRGFDGEFSCEIRLQALSSKAQPERDPRGYLFKMVVHGPKGLNESISTEGEHVGAAVSRSFSKLESRLAKHHERRSDFVRHRNTKQENRDRF